MNGISPSASNDGSYAVLSIGGTDNTVLTVVGGGLTAGPGAYARIVKDPSTGKTDTYDLRLTKEPTADVTVSVLTDGLVAILQPFGITEMVQTGTVAMTRGPIGEAAAAAHPSIPPAALSGTAA